MECPSCTFQNMPGSARCARCGALLSFAAQTIEVHPPRATALTKTLGGWRQPAIIWRRIRQAISAELFPSRSRATEHAHLDLPTVLRCVIPGWANAHTGHPLVGALFLLCYLLLVVPGTMAIGQIIGAQLLGLAFAVHLVSIVTALVPRFESYRDRMLFTLACGAILAGVYYPCLLLLSRIATPLAINAEWPPVQEGDVVWYHPTRSIKAGQYAVFDDRGRDFALPNGYRYRAQMHILAGMRIDQVIATSGQTIAWDKGTMLLDGAPAQVQLKAGFAEIWPKLTVPEGMLLVDPENLVPGVVATRNGFITTTGQVHGEPMQGELRIDAAQLQSMALIPANSVVGRLIWRSWPLRRAEFF
jgi:hypothetical protein